MITITNKVCGVCHDNVYNRKTKTACVGSDGHNRLLLPCGHAVHVSCQQDWEREKPTSVTQCLWCKTKFDPYLIPQIPLQDKTIKAYECGYNESPTVVGSIVLTVWVTFIWGSLSLESKNPVDPNPNRDRDDYSAIVIGMIFFVALNATAGMLIGHLRPVRIVVGTIFTLPIIVLHTLETLGRRLAIARQRFDRLGARAR